MASGKSAGLCLLVVFAFLAACATAERPVQPMRPASSAELAMGYQEAIDLGSRYVAENGYGDAELHGADRLHPNIWRVRFGRGSNGMLELYFDGVHKTLIKAEEIQGISGKTVTDPIVPPPKRP